MATAYTQEAAGGGAAPGGAAPGSAAAAATLPAESAAETDILFDQLPPPPPPADESDIPFEGGVAGGGLGLTWNLLRFVVVLALVAAATYGVVYFIKRSQKNQITENAHLKVLAAVPVTARAQAAVIAVGNQAYLVGAGESGLSLIAQVTDKETIDALLLDYAREGSAAVGRLSFKALLARFGVRTGTDAAGAPPTDITLSAQRERLERL